MNSQPIIYVVDDDYHIRRSLSMLLTPRYPNVVTYASGEEFLSAHEPLHPGCLLLDVQMPEISGLEVQQKLVAAESLLPIIIITAHGDVPLVVRTMRSGAVEFLPKPFSKVLLFSSIDRALEYNAAALREDEHRQECRRRINTLTMGERQVLDLLLQGRLNKQIAAALDVSVRTVELRRNRIYTKMGVKMKSLVQLVQMVGSAKLLTDVLPTAAEGGNPSPRLAKHKIHPACQGVPNSGPRKIGVNA